jgi:branched-chain amino acid transport system substrate-binding protein
MKMAKRIFVVLALLLTSVTLTQAQDTIRIGYVSPQTGPLAAFGEADEFILGGIEEAVTGGIDINGTTYNIEIIVRDTQSDPNRAAEVAADLILVEGVNLIVVASTPETTNPVSDQCEVFQVPCISTVAPWQPWYFRSPDATEPDFAGYAYTYHFFWGLEDIIGVFLEMWNSQETNRVVGGLWPNDGDGLAWSHPELGFPPALEAAGYTVVDPGRYENLKDDFSAEIAMFKENDVQIVTGVMIPPDLGTFLTQASQQDFNPVMFTVGKAALFPSVVETISDGLGANLTTEIWWTPNHPFTSSLTGISSADLGTAYTEATGRQVTQPIGFAHALFEVAIDALQRTEDVNDPASIAAAISQTSLDTIVGRVEWGLEGLPPNVAKTPLVGGQWQVGEAYPFELIITSNTAFPDIPLGGDTLLKLWE